ncbi:MAG: MaoC family dehydratase N-terminal domain-containing protein [Lentimicrobiaceae bacterium]|jgi:acyl dehydratase|nr:MaoC family dehydratase N-terminal domain-containing protein [Lentimicrobiaceae bacterium]
MLKVGDSTTEKVVFSKDEVIAFVKLIGDPNPVHLDEEYAKNSYFKRLAVQGMHAASTFSRVIGERFPGEASINIYREFTFIRPIYINEEYIMTFKVVNVNTETHVGTIKCRFINAQGKICIDCLTRIKNPIQFI